MIGCKTTKPMLFASKSPISIEVPYFQSWVAGVQGGGSGIDVFLPVKDLNNITPLTAYIFEDSMLKQCIKTR
jgi:hypothetical protein